MRFASKNVKAGKCTGTIASGSRSLYRIRSKFTQAKKYCLSAFNTGSMYSTSKSTGPEYPLRTASVIPVCHWELTGENCRLVYKINTRFCGTTLVGEACGSSIPQTRGPPSDWIPTSKQQILNHKDRFKCSFKDHIRVFVRQGKITAYPS